MIQNELSLLLLLRWNAGIYSTKCLSTVFAIFLNTGVIRGRAIQAVGLTGRMNPKPLPWHSVSYSDNVVLFAPGWFS